MYSKVDFEILLADAATQSVPAIAELTAFASHLCCLTTQYERMLAVMYCFLDARNIPRDDDATPFISVPCASLMFIGSTFSTWLSDDNMASGLIAGLLTHWSDIRSWIVYLYTKCIQPESVNLNTRRECKAAIVTILALTRDRMLGNSWSKKVVADTKIMPVIFSLWNLETSDARFSSYTGRSNANRDSVVLNSCFLISHETNTPIEWNHALRPFEGNLSTVSKAALSHLSQEMGRRHLDPECIALDVHIITALSFRDDMRESLFRLGVIKAMVDVIQLIVGLFFDPPDITYAARCISNASLYLRVRMQETDGIPWLSEALRANIINGLVRCERFLPFMDNDKAREAPSAILHFVIPAYTVYRSTLLPVAKAVDAVKAIGLDKKLDSKGKLYAGWRFLDESTQRRKQLLRDGLNEVHIQTCHNDTCRKTLPTGKLKRCGGCLHTYYCSKPCQRYDWRRGKHKAYCTRIQERSAFSFGSMRGISKRDLKFLDCVIEDELMKHKPRIAAHGLTINVIEIDITQGEQNISFDSRGVQPSPFKLLCRCEHYMNEKWKRMRQDVIRANEPCVLVRVFVPGGISRKVILRAIPLFKVLGRAVPRSSIYVTHIYSCCGEPGQEDEASPLRTFAVGNGERSRSLSVSQ